MTIKERYKSVYSHARSFAKYGQTMNYTDRYLTKEFMRQMLMCGLLPRPIYGQIWLSVILMYNPNFRLAALTELL